MQGEMRNRILIKKQEGKRQLLTSMHRWEDIKMFSKIGWIGLGVNWIHLTQDMVQ
jgi:hypothetical protein